LSGAQYASPAEGVLSPPAAATSEPAAAVKESDTVAAVAPPAAPAVKAGKEDDAWYLLNDDSNDIDIDFESLIRSLSTEVSCCA
jgi:hypothetical protein